MHDHAFEPLYQDALEYLDIFADMSLFHIPVTRSIIVLTIVEVFTLAEMIVSTYGNHLDYFPSFGYPLSSLWYSSLFSLLLPAGLFSQFISPGRCRLRSEWSKILDLNLCCVVEVFESSLHCVL